MRILISFLIVVALASCVQTNRGVNVSTFTEAGVLYGSTTDEQTCKKQTNTVWVAFEDTHECIKYYAAGLNDTNPIVHFHIHGDIATAYYFQRRVSNVLKRYLSTTETSMQRYVNTMSIKNDIPFIFIGRPGTFGSSGFHGDRYSELNPRLINAAIDAIKRKHNIKKVSLSGQSGGGIAVAALLNWREDIQCAVLASSIASLIDTIKERYPGENVSRYEGLIYDPSRHINQMKHDENRKIFVLADKQDDVVKYSSQRAYADRVADAGHHVEFRTMKALGSRNHDLSATAIKTASDCLKHIYPAIKSTAKTKKTNRKLVSGMTKLSRGGKYNKEQMTSHPTSIQTFNVLWNKFPLFSWDGRQSHELIELYSNPSKTFFSFTSDNDKIGYCLINVMYPKQSDPIKWDITCNHKDQASGVITFSDDKQVMKAIGKDDFGKTVILEFNTAGNI